MEIIDKIRVMREIKFRGYSNECEQWCYGSLDLSNYHDHNEAIIIEHEDSKLGFNVDYDTIGQYTGLKDKNGVEIYEGDIFTTPQNRWIVKGDVRAYCYDAKCLTKKHLTRTLWGLCDENANIEVIGNIFDNPEMLNQIRG